MISNAIILVLRPLAQPARTKGLKTSIIALDIAQFFPSLNHSMLTSILSHFGFANCIVDFFSDYLVGRSTQYSWNSFISGACDADVDVGQGSALSPILFFFIINLSHGTQLQFIADYLLQVVYNFCLRKLKPPS